MKKIFIFVLVLAVLGGAGYLLINRDAATKESSQEVVQPVTTELKEYTLADISVHNTKDDCWTVIEGKVYDISSYIPRHSGGDNILSACGTDGTAFFKGQQAGSLGGKKNHTGDRDAQNDLKKLQIGNLVN